MTSNFQADQVEAFYRAALIGLRVLDERAGKGQRFGPEADARWSNFQGHLGMSARLDILVRDAAVQWGAAFSPAAVFRLPGLATDEPFGPDWSGLADHVAKKLWADIDDGWPIDACARTLGLAPTDPSVPDLAPSTRLVLAGGGATLAVATAFAERSDLSWTNQVMVVADDPEERQFAGLIAPLLGAGGPTVLVGSGDDIAEARKAVGFMGEAEAVISTDASYGESDFARRAALGG